MADNEKKYAGLTALQTFLDNLKNLFATQTAVDELSANVAYIDEEDNEDISIVDDTIITNEELNELQTLLGDES